MFWKNKSTKVDLDMAESSQEIAALRAEIDALREQNRSFREQLDKTTLELGHMTGERDGYKNAYEITGAELGYLRGYTAPVVRSAIDPSRAGKPSIFVVTLPKSGTVFIGNTIKQSLDYDFTSVLVTPTFPKNIVWQAMVVDFMRGGMISVAHMQPDLDNFWAMRNNGLSKAVLHYRDPRAAWWSWYHFVKSRPAEEVHLSGSQTDRFIARSEKDQIDSLINTFFVDAVKWLNGWMELIEAKPQFECLRMSHEELASDDIGYFRKVFDFYGIDAEPKPVAKSTGTHFRKGDNEDWRTVISDAQAARMTDMMSDKLCSFYGFKR